MAMAMAMETVLWSLEATGVQCRGLAGQFVQIPGLFVLSYLILSYLSCTDPVLGRLCG